MKPERVLAASGVLLLALAAVAASPSTGQGRIGAINIKDYGAKCDGSTSDLTAIRAAVAAAISAKRAVYIPTSASGCVIPTGSNSADVVTLTGPVSFIGNGPKSTIYIKGTTWVEYPSGPSYGYFHVATTTSTSGYTFQDMRFLGDYSVSSTGPAFPGAAINFGNNADLKIVTNDTRVSGVTFEKLGGPAIQWGGGDYNLDNCCRGTSHLVTNNLFINSGSLNNQVNAYSDGVRGAVITNNVFRDNIATAIEMAGYEHTISGNTFTRVHGNGVLTTGRDPAGEGILIANNTFTDIGTSTSSTPDPRACIQIGEGSGAQRTMVANNNLHNCAQHGIWATSGITDLMITGNYVDCTGWGSTGAGVYVGAGAVRGQVTGNYVRACNGTGTSNYGILVSGRNTDFWVDRNTTAGTFSGSSFVLGAALGAEAVAGGTRDYVGMSNFDLSVGSFVPPTNLSNAAMIPLFADGGTTPSVAGWNAWRTTNTNPTTITNFTGGTLGQVIVIVFRDNNTTLTHGANILLRKGSNKTYTSDDAAMFVKDYSNWREIPSSVP